MSSILYVTGELFYYDAGNDRYVSRFSAGNFLKLLQKELGMRSSFAFPVSRGAPPDSWSSFFDAASSDVEPLPGWEGVLSYYRMLFDPRVFFSLRRTVRRLVSAYDVFWIRIPHPFGLWLGAAAEKRGKRVIYNVVGDVRFAYRSDKYKGLMKSVAKAAGAYFHGRSLRAGKGAIFLCVGSVLCDAYRRANRTAYHFVDSVCAIRDMQTPKERFGRPVRVLYVGKLIKAKGIYLLIKAMDELAGRHAVELDIVGHGKESETVRKMAGERKYATFHGFVPQGPALNAIYRSCDMLVMGSLFSEEGFPRVILEAWANGLFVVSADIAGIRSLGRDGENLLFFEPGNVRDLADKIETVLGDVSVRGALKRGIVAVQPAISSERMIGCVKDALRGAV